MQRTYTLAAKQTSLNRSYPTLCSPSRPHLTGYGSSLLIYLSFPVTQGSHGIKRHKPDRLKGKCIEAHVAQLCGKGRGAHFTQCLPLSLSPVTMCSALPKPLGPATHRGITSSDSLCVGFSFILYPHPQFTPTHSFFIPSSSVLSPKDPVFLCTSSPLDVVTQPLPQRSGIPAVCIVDPEPFSGPELPIHTPCFLL